jgi:hypothetical protein
MSVNGSNLSAVEQVRRCATNSATDSEMKGFFGVSGGAYIIPILGIFGSALLYFWVINQPHSDAASIVNWVVTLTPAVGSFGYVFYFIVNRPKRFRHDWLDGILNGPHYNHRARRHIRHPLQKLQKQTQESEQKILRAKYG